jgi:hypothetical protein
MFYLKFIYSHQCACLAIYENQILREILVFFASTPQNGIRAVLNDDTSIIVIRETLQTIDIDIFPVPVSDSTIDSEFEERYNQEWDDNENIRYYNEGDYLWDMDNIIDDSDWGYRSD